MKIPFKFKKSKEYLTALRDRQRSTPRQPSLEMSTASTVVGLFARAVVLLIGVYGLILFLSDALGFLYFEQKSTLESGMVITVSTSGYITEGALFLTSLIASAFLAVGLSHKYTAIAMPIGAGVYFLHIALKFGNPFLAFENMLRCVYNTALTHMAEYGYLAFSSYRVSQSYSYDVNLLMKEGVVFLTIVIALCVFTSMMRRVKLIPSLITVLIILVPVFIYNISKSTTGFAFVLVFLCGAIAMWLFDNRYSNRALNYAEIMKKKREAAKIRREKKNADKAKKQSLHSEEYEAYLTTISSSGNKKEASAAADKIRLEFKKRAKNEKLSRKKEKILLKAENKKQKRIKKEEKAALRRSLRKTKKNSPEYNLILEKLNAEKTAKKKISKEKRRLKIHKTNLRRSNIAAAGFAGFTAAAIAFAAILAPHQLSKGDFPVLKQMESFMYYAREYVTSILTGSDLDLNEASLYRDYAELAPRILTFESPNYSERKLYNVRSGYNSPVYLRTWVASDFSINDSAWTSADYDEINLYRVEFGRDFTPDTLTTLYYRMMFPEDTEIDRVDYYMSFAKYGFIMHQTNVEKISNDGLLMPMPTVFDSSVGILKYDSLSPSRLRYSSYYDGVFSSNFFSAGDKFSSYTFSRFMKNDAVSAQIEQLYKSYVAAFAYYDVINTHIPGASLETEDIVSQIEADTVISALNDYFGKTIIEYIDSQSRDSFNSLILNSILDYFEIDESLREATVNMVLSDEFSDDFKEFVELEKGYRAYVEQNYKATTGNSNIQALAQALLKDSGYVFVESLNGIPQYSNIVTGETVSANDVIMTVINYFKENFTYSLTPTIPDPESSFYSTVLEQFLFENRVGYCAHFATAAAALLREYGFSVRYCEGYIADYFKRDTKESESLTYKTSVYDSDAHAWIEVYFPGMGWVMYETTPSFVENMYNYPEENDPSDDPQPPESETQPPESESEPESEQSSDATERLPESSETSPHASERNPEMLRKYLYISLALIALAIAASIIVKIVQFVIKRADGAVEKRVSLIQGAMSKERFDVAPIKYSREITRSLSDSIITIFAALGYAQKTGELPSEYANRLKIKYADLSKKDLSVIIELIQKEEFGHGLSYDELCYLAEYLRELTAGIYVNLKWYDRIRLRYLRHVL